MNGANTTDGSCGAANGNTVCGNWPEGACCSQYGVIISCYHLDFITNNFSTVETIPLTVELGVRVDHAC